MGSLTLDFSEPPLCRCKLHPSKADMQISRGFPNLFDLLCPFLMGHPARLPFLGIPFVRLPYAGRLHLRWQNEVISKP